MRIILDAMGGDYAPQVAVEGAVMAAREFGVEVILVGREEAIRAELSKHNISGLSLPIVHASQVIEMQEHPAAAVKAKPDSSMVVGMKMLKHGRGRCIRVGWEFGWGVGCGHISFGPNKRDKTPRPRHSLPNHERLLLLN